MDYLRCDCRRTVPHVAKRTPPPAKTVNTLPQQYRPGHIFDLAGHIYILTRTAPEVDKGKLVDGFYVRELAVVPESFEFWVANDDPQFTGSDSAG
jgi:hypothetical protein